jgi:hypothetical protein
MNEKHILITDELKEAPKAEGSILVRPNAPYSENWSKPTGYHYALVKPNAVHNPPEGQVVISVASSIVADDNASGYSITYGVPTYGPKPPITEAASYRVAAALELAGHTDADILAAIETLPEPTRTIARNGWNRPPVNLHTDHPLVLAVTAVLTASDPSFDIDAIFAVAVTLP